MAHSLLTEIDVLKFGYAPVARLNTGFKCHLLRPIPFVVRKERIGAPGCARVGEQIAQQRPSASGSGTDNVRADVFRLDVAAGGTSDQLQDACVAATVSDCCALPGFSIASR